MTIPRWVFVNLLLFSPCRHRFQQSLYVFSHCKCGICIGWWIVHSTPQRFPFLFTPHRQCYKSRKSCNTRSLQLVFMPWHLLFESFNPAAVSGLCHAMGSVGILFSWCDDLDGCQFRELKLFDSILVSGGHDESLGWSDATGPWLALRIAAAWPRNLGHWHGGTKRSGGVWHLARCKACIYYSYITKKVAVQKLCRCLKPRICGDFFWLLHILRCDSQPDLFTFNPVVRAGRWVNRFVLLTGRVWEPIRGGERPTGDDPG